jgi:hypothetical protein
MIVVSTNTVYDTQFELTAYVTIPSILDPSNPAAGNLIISKDGRLEYHDGESYKPLSINITLEEPKIFQDMVVDYMIRQTEKKSTEELLLAKYPEARQAREIYDDIIRQLASLEIIKNG